MKEWYVYVLGNIEGPFDIMELRRHPEITPETLVWKEGFDDWVPIREVKELKSVFEDAESLHDKPIKPFSKKKLPADDEVLTLQYEPFHWFIWLFIIIMVMLYVLYKLG